MQNDVIEQDYLTTFRGSFSNILRWEQLDALWQQVENSKQSWYIYAVGELPPTTPATAQELSLFVSEINTLLHNEHQEDYCGIVYTDKREAPSFIKIYDPNNLGVSCGFSNNPPLPGWILSHLQPINLPSALPQTGSRKRWWKRLFA